MGSFPSANPSLPTSVPGIYVAESAVGPAIPVPVNQGGTGQTTAAAALAALGGSGSHTLKRGTGAGNYTGSQTSFTAIDATNLDITVTIPVGLLALAFFFFSQAPDANHTMDVGIAVDGTVAFAVFQGGTTITVPGACMAILAGDGSSHTFEPQVQTGSGGTWIIANATALIAPFHAVLLTPAT